MRKGTIILALALLASAAASAQTIRGTVKDIMTKEELIGATVRVEGMETKAAVVDMDGKFVIENVPVGRYNIVASYVGYVPGVFMEVLVSTAKETLLDFELEENLKQLGEVLVTPTIQKQKALNPMSIVGARMISVEEASRFAGGFDDPGRLAACYAGVASTGTQNGISIHGNSPHLVQWHVEGVEVASPSHLVDTYYEGGGVISALSAQVMGNSDFISAAFPAEYGNSLSGVFDVKLRNGNAMKREHTAQLGLLGLETASEGPISAKHNSTYVLNVRYSTLGTAHDIGLIPTGEVIKYQDINFKLNFPTKRLGTFSVFGIAWNDHAFVNLEEPSEWSSIYDQENTDLRQKSVVTGVSHNIRIGSRGRLKTTAAFTYLESKILDSYHLFGNGIDGQYDQYANYKLADTHANNYLDVLDRRRTLSVSTSYQHRISDRMTWMTGAEYTSKSLDYSMRKAEDEYSSIDAPAAYRKRFDTNTSLWGAYTQLLWNLTPSLTANAGLRAQRLTFNKKTTLEPRVSFKLRTSDKGSLAFGYSNQSMIDRMDCFYENPDLGFIRSDQFMLAYSHNISENLNFKAEAFAQFHHDVPVDDDGYSVLNRYDFYEMHGGLKNEGKGRVYGIDLTLDKYMSNGFYYQLNASAFKSEYCAADGIWHHNLFDRGFVTKALGGKEWMLGKKKQNILNVSAKLMLMGGLRYTPLDEAQSVESAIVLDESRPFASQLDPELTLDLTVSYKMNGKDTAHEVGVKWLNVTDTGAYMEHVFNYKNKGYEPYYMGYTFPNVYYKYHF